MYLEIFHAWHQGCQIGPDFQLNLATLAAAVLTTIKTSQKLLTQPRKLKRAIKINWVARLGGKSGPIWQPWWQQT